MCSALHLLNFAPTYLVQPNELLVTRSRAKSLGLIFEREAHQLDWCTSSSIFRHRHRMLAPVVSYHYPCPDGIFAALAAHLKFVVSGVKPIWVPNTVYVPQKLEDLHLKVSRIFSRSCLWTSTV